MKKAILIAVLMLLFGAVNAKPVEPAQARRAAESLLGRQVVDVTPDAFTHCYLLVGADAEGFVLMAADDCVRPVLAYSVNGHFPVYNMPPHVAAWLEGYQREIAETAAAGLPQSERVAAEWTALLQGRGAKTGGSVVPPLLTTTWNQRPLYNLLCPFDTHDSAYSVTGCTATATAQVMKFWNHPEVGWGSHSYHHNAYGTLGAVFDTTHYRWSLMPDALTSVSDSTQIMAVAELMYHVGVAVNMNYSPSGSGAAVNAHGIANYPSAETALKTYFKYSPMLHSIYKSEHTDSEWDSMLYAEIEAGRPVLYAGFDSSGGHAFVLDGIDSTGLFHVNWGWGGAYDGYYTTDSLAPGAGGVGGNATYTFNMNNSAVIGIVPSTATSDTVAVVDVRFDPAYGLVEGNGTYTPFVDQVTITARAAEGYRFVRWQSGSSDNPLFFLANGDLTDSAIFERVLGDTVGYCGNGLHTAWRDDYGDLTQWAIRLPASVRHGHRSLSAIQYVPYQRTVYSLAIYIADSIEGAEPVYSADLTPDYSELQRWVTYTLDSALWIADSATVWIAFSSYGDNYPASMTRYSGNPDGIWYHLPDGWTPYDRHDVYYTWMLRGIFEERLCRVDVTTNLDQWPGDLERAGISIVGAGDYFYGDTACLVVNPGISFAWGWGEEDVWDHENPKRFQVLGDTTLYAWFSYCTGIDGTEGDSIVVRVLGRSVSIDVPETMPIAVHDVQGRLVSTRRSFTAPAAGVYIISLDGTTVKRIVIY